MDRSLFRHSGSADNAETPAPEEQPPGVHQPALMNPFIHDFSGSIPGGSQPDLSGIIRRPAGLPSSQVGRRVDTPRGGNTPLSAALTRALAADAALHAGLHGEVDAPPPGSGPPVTSRFWVEKGAWKHREKHVVFLSAIDFLAQVHKV